MVDLYENHMAVYVDVDGDNAHVSYYIAHALRSYLVVVIGMSIFIDKSVTYFDIFYLRYFIDLEKIQKYN